MKRKRSIRFDLRDGMSLQEIGDILGVSAERVRQIEYKALQKLRNRTARGKHPDLTALRQHYEEICE